LINFGHLESSLNPEPLFFVQQPDGVTGWAEIDRQAAFLKHIRLANPSLLVFATPNAGKRNPFLARKEGIMAGVFDICVIGVGMVAYIEFKGYAKSGNKGKLSNAQIEFGNRCVALQIPCACFYDPHAAVDWLKSVGFAARSSPLH